MRLVLWQHCHGQVRPERQGVDAAGKQNRRDVISGDAVHDEPEDRSDGRGAQRDSWQPPAGREEDDPGPQEIELFLHRERPEVADSAAPLVAHTVDQKEVHVGEVGRMPGDALPYARHLAEPRDGQREVVQREDPEDASNVKVPQRQSGRRLAGVAERPGPEQDTGDEEPAQHEEHPHADSAEVHVLTRGTVEMVAEDQRDRERPKPIQLGHVAQRGGGRPDGVAATHAVSDLSLVRRVRYPVAAGSRGMAKSRRCTAACR